MKSPFMHEDRPNLDLFLITTLAREEKRRDGVGLEGKGEEGEAARGKEKPLMRGTLLILSGGGY